MSLLKLIDTNTTPPDGYRFIHPEDGYRTGPFNAKADWLLAILKHKEDNGYPVAPDWQAQAEDQLARMLPPGWGYYENGEAPQHFIDARMGYEDVMNGMRVLIEFVRQGAPLVDQQLAESRAKTCSACFYNIRVAGCGTCIGLANIVEEVATNKHTESDGVLEDKSCGICRCVSRAHIWLPADVLAKGVNDGMMELFNEVPWCWKAKEIRALS